MREIVFASSNRDKLRELESLLGSSGILLLFGPDLYGAEIKVEENCSSYAGNAMQKAAVWARVMGIPALADDSGLEVRSLDWGPGVRSARVASDDVGRVSWLLRRMSGKSDRSARFVAALALVDPSAGEWILAEGICNGEISSEPSGNEGFGYDPVFIPDGYSKTIAELGPEVKSGISHRAIAARAISCMLENRSMVE
ncbi:MAG TPA: RdgB/HAM1 family non-canonical purine NTP pyrophosphatase [Thermovirgaceae bacterium]|nr:RdgB/HAM1 family non-canonical purine NTP pyrophosphatase [Thermovirgaceae bacterium]